MQYWVSTLLTEVHFYSYCLADECFGRFSVTFYSYCLSYEGFGRVRVTFYSYSRSGGAGLGRYSVSLGAASPFFDGTLGAQCKNRANPCK